MTLPRHADTTLSYYGGYEKKRDDLSSNLAKKIGTRTERRDQNEPAGVHVVNVWKWVVSHQSG